MQQVTKLADAANLEGQSEGLPDYVGLPHPADLQTSCMLKKEKL